MLKRVIILIGFLLSVSVNAQVVGGGPVIGGGGSGGGSGDVVGPLSATDNAIVRFDATTGKLVQTSNLTCSDVSGVTTTLATITPAATTGASVAGQAIAITASPAVASTDTNGAAAGGSVTITAGAAARLVSGNANGGDINLTPGAGIGTGTTGAVNITAGNLIGNADIYAAATLYVGGSTAATSEAVMDLNTAYLGSGYKVAWGSAGTPSAYSFNPDTGMSRNAAGVIRATDGSSGIRGFVGGGTAVASATAMPLPTGRAFHVTGTTTITSITSTNFQSGVCVTLIFDDVLTFTDGSNLKLNGSLSTTTDDTISLCYDGTNWFETSRSVN